MSLRHVTDADPGIRRKSAGKGFAYVDPEGRRIRDTETLDRIRSIVIPPAWTDVWICPIDSGHIQATGRDARGRKQYRYHPAWTAAQDEAKYDRMIAFGEALPRLRRKVTKDLREPPLSRARVLATVVRLMERTLIRVGNEEYARTNRSYGLTTLQNRHVRIRGSRLEFKFRAKSGVLQQIELEDPSLARSVKRIQELPGQTLFQYVDAAGETQKIDSADVNEYVQGIAGIDFTAKDFRTWFGTVLAAIALRDIAAAHAADDSQTARNRQIVTAIDQVRGALGNTRAVCRKCYVHPAILEAFLEGETIPATAVAGGNRRGSHRTAAERAALILLLRRRDRRPSSRRGHGAGLGARIGAAA